MIPSIVARQIRETVLDYLRTTSSPGSSKNFKPSSITSKS